VAADGREVGNIGDFIRILEDFEIGQMITLRVQRDGQVRTVDVKIMDLS
jgi:S1-C subfamily serine protease